jgi:hypothetical protein
MNEAEKMIVRKTSMLLTSQATQRVNFYYKGLVFGPAEWRYVSECLTWSLTHKGIFGGIRGIGVKIAKMPANTGAQYEIDDDVIKVPNAGFGDTAWEKMTLVHESTHACIDALYKKKKVPRLDNEASAYLAGALYNVYRAASVDGPFDYNPGSSGIYYEAHQVAIAHRRSAEKIGFKGLYQVFEKDAAKMLRAIQDSKTYEGYFKDPKKTYGDNGLDF